MSITSSVRASKDGGMVRSSAFAVLRLIISRKRVGYSSGIEANQIVNLVGAPYA